MKIAHVTATFLPYYSGTANVVYRTCEYLHQQGHEITVFTPLGSSQPRFPFAVQYQKAMFKIGNAAFTPSLIHQLAGFDLIHLHYPYIFGAELCFIAAKIHKIPIVLTYHQNLAAKDYRQTLFWLYRKTIQPFLLSQATEIFVTSLDYALSPPSALQPYQQKMTELPNTINTNLYKPPDTPNKQPYVLFVGGMDSAHYFKGIDILITALANLPQATAIFVGQGNLRPNFEQQAKAQCENRIQFIGNCSEEELIKLYQEALVTVLPSTSTGEAFGLVILESMACGTPVIATALPGVRTLIKDTLDGYLIEANNPKHLADVIEKMIINPQLAQEMGRKASQKVQTQYNQSTVGNQLESKYNTIVGRSTKKYP
jgi:glycosyltransferase involved in cell wall biosynthesis